MSKVMIAIIGNKNVKVLEKYEITKHSPRETKTFIATINWIEDRGDSWYIGYTPDDSRICRWGCFHIKKEGRYGKINYTLK